MCRGDERTSRPMLRSLSWLAMALYADLSVVEKSKAMVLMVAFYVPRQTHIVQARRND